MKAIKEVLNYLKNEHLILTTAESCTAGRVIHLLAKYAGSGQCLEAGYVVYSKQAKKRLLNVKQQTIDKFTLTSEEVAREMVVGALRDSSANAVVATTGIAGSEPMDGIPAGTICFGWGFQFSGKMFIYSETQHFEGKKVQVLTDAAKYALVKIPSYHQLAKEQQKISQCISTI
jgi:nicotinamide-nucleotide amidase